MTQEHHMEREITIGSARLVVDDPRGVLGASEEALERRIARLIERELVSRQAVGPELEAGLALTERGERIKAVLAGNWEELENALLGELGKKERKGLDEVLKRFVELLRL